MLEKPDLPDTRLTSCLRDAYGLRIAKIEFLPLGADVNTAVYRAVSEDETPYFVKLRRGAWQAASVLIPAFLRDQGIEQIIAPIETRDGHLWTRLDAFTVTLSPFVRGENGFTRHLSDRNWVALGAALKRMHTAAVPRTLSAQLPEESYSPQWRDAVRSLQELVEHGSFDDPAAVRFAALLREQRETVTTIVARAEQLGEVLRANPPQPVLCHADIHAGNVLIDDDDTLHIVDWDTLTLAPKERDLMFVGGGVSQVWNSPREEELFYEGYGPTEINSLALPYYRYERIVVDVAEFGAQLLLTGAGDDDRAQSLRYFASMFMPNNVVDIAFRSAPLRCLVKERYLMGLPSGSTAP